MYWTPRPATLDTKTPCNVSLKGCLLSGATSALVGKNSCNGKPIGRSSPNQGKQVVLWGNIVLIADLPSFQNLTFLPHHCLRSKALYLSCFTSV